MSRMPYIVYKVSGISGFGKSDEDIIELRICDYDVKLDFVLNDSIIQQIIVVFAENVTITSYLKGEITKYIRCYLIALITEFEADLRNFSITIESIYNPNDNNSEIRLESIIKITDSIRPHLNHKVVAFKKALSKVPNDDDKKEPFLLLENILKIDNIEVRFLMQYELLKSLVQPNTQKGVTKYIRNIYNPSIEKGNINFLKTRRANKNFWEDNITYFRNYLAHGDVTDTSTLNDFITDTSEYSKKINQIILHAINN